MKTKITPLPHIHLHAPARICLCLPLLLTALKLYGTTPAEDFARSSIISDVSISEDGKSLAYLAYSAQDKETALVFRNLATNKSEAITPHGGVMSYLWTVPNRVVYYGSWGFAAIDCDGNNYKGLTGMAAYQDAASLNRDYQGGMLGHQMLGYNKRTHHITLLHFDAKKAPWGHPFGIIYQPDVATLNVYTGALVFDVIKNPGTITNWLADYSGTVRIGLETNSEDKIRTYLIADDGSRTILPGCDFTDRPLARPYKLSGDGRTLYMHRLTDDNTWGIYGYDLSSKKFGDLVISHKINDISGLYMDRENNLVLGAYYNGDIPISVWFDEQMKTTQQAIDTSLPKKANLVTSMSSDRKKMIIYSTAADTPTSYYHYDSEKKQLTFLFNAKPWLKPEKLAKVYPVRYKSKTGQSITGYLTVPNGREPKKLPLLMLVGHWPGQRTHWGFNSFNQFLADRGYAVLEVNFRGSYGFGYEFEHTADKKWGDIPQSDIEDGVRWAVRTGVADPERIGIINAPGHLFGGYCVLNGLIRAPDLYACAINIGGITSWPDYLKELRRIAPLAYERMICGAGSLKENFDTLESMLPMKEISKIRAPMLFAYGKDNNMDLYPHVQTLMTLLKDEGKTVKLFTKANESNYFQDMKKRTELYEAIEAFLSKHMPAK